MTEKSASGDNQIEKKLISENSFELKNIDRFYKPKVVYGKGFPTLSVDELKRLDPECKAIKKILILYTGGTIGMRKKNGAYEPEPNFFCKALLKLPMFNDSRFRKEFNLPNNIFVMPRSPDNIRVAINVWEYNPLLDSSDMTMDDYIGIANDIHSEYDSYDGFIILHGTDTMSFTGSGLSFLFENLSKPVILTGSQIPLFEIRSDGRENLLAAVIIASHYKIPEVTLYFHEKLFRANRTSKVSSMHFEAFDSPNYPPLADAGISIRVHHHRLFIPEKDAGPFRIHTSLVPDVALLRMFPSITYQTVKAFLSPPVKGVVLLTYGSGNMPFCRKDLLELFKEAADRGCIIINITQCWKGGVKAIYRTGFILREYGIYPGLDMTLEAALNKLSYVLSRSDWSIETKRIAMTRNLRGEITVSCGETSRELRSLSQDDIVIDTEMIVGTSLCSNAKFGNVAMIEQIGKRFGHYDATDYDGKTALHVASSENQIEVVKFLLEKGVPPNGKNRLGHTPLFCAIVQKSDVNLIRELRNGGATLELTSKEICDEVTSAIYRNDLPLFLLFVEAGVDVNFQDDIGNTFLHLAAIYGKLSFVNALLELNCDPQIRNSHNNTALDEAQVRDHGDIVDILSKLEINSEK